MEDINNPKEIRKWVCPNCETVFKIAPRCPECGQLIKKYISTEVR